MKKLFGILALVLLLAGAGVWYFVTFHLDNMIRQRIEQAAERTLGVPVTVGSVTTDLKQGSLAIGDVTVANPPGFRNPNAFTLEGIEAAVDFGTLEVRRIVIEQPEIVIEEIGGATNIDVLLQATDAPAPPPADETDEPTRLVIRYFRMNESRAAFESQTLDHYSDVEIDAVELEDISGTPTEVGRQIARGVLEEVVTAAALEMLKAKASEKIDEAAKKLEELFKRD